MQKLEREQLPDLAMKQSRARKGQVSVDINFGVKEQHALKKKGRDQNKYQPGGNVGRVVRVPHIETVSNGHFGDNRELLWECNSRTCGLAVMSVLI
jgi:hypothetical protein